MLELFLFHSTELICTHERSQMPLFSLFKKETGVYVSEEATEEIIEKLKDRLSLGIVDSKDFDVRMALVVATDSFKEIAPSTSLQ